MNIRVTQRALSKQYLNNMGKTLTQMNDLNNKILAQRKFLRASENPIGAARALTIRKGLADLAGYDDNLTTAEGIFSSAETNLMTISGEITTVSSKLIAGVNGEKSQTERDIIAAEIQGLAENMMKELNSTYADRNLFGGTNNSSKAFTYENGVVSFNGKPVNTNFEFFTAGGQTYVKDAAKDVTSQVLDGTAALPALTAGTTYYINYSDVDLNTGLTTNGEDISAYLSNTSDPRIVVTDKLVSDGTVTYLDPKTASKQSNYLGFDGTSPILVDIGLGIKDDGKGGIDPNTALDISLNGAEYTGSGTDSDGDSLNILQLTYDAAQALRDGDVEKARALIDKIEGARSTLLIGITNLGVKEASIKNYQARNETETASLQAAQVEVEGMSTEDLAEAMTQYKMIEAAYNATLQMGASVIPTSLFDFIK